MTNTIYYIDEGLQLPIGIPTEEKELYDEVSKYLPADWFPFYPTSDTAAFRANAGFNCEAWEIAKPILIAAGAAGGLAGVALANLIVAITNGRAKAAHCPGY